jgi:hypothetical protein
MQRERPAGHTLRREQVLLDQVVDRDGASCSMSGPERPIDSSSSVTATMRFCES